MFFPSRSRSSCITISRVVLYLAVLTACLLFTSLGWAGDRPFRVANGSSNLFFASNNASTEQDETADDSNDDDQEMDDDESNDDGEETDSEPDDEDTDDEESDDQDETDEDESDDDDGDEMNDDDEDEGSAMTSAALVGERTFFSASQLAATLASSLDPKEEIAGPLDAQAAHNSAISVDSAFVDEDPTADALIAAEVSVERAIRGALGQNAVPEPSTWILSAIAILAMQMSRLRQVHA